MVPLSYTKFRTLHPFFKIVVNAVFLKYKKSQKQIIFSTIHSQEIVVSPLSFTDRNDRSPHPFIYSN